jgi:hypothetical protein
MTDAASNDGFNPAPVEGGIMEGGCYTGSDEMMLSGLAFSIADNGRCFFLMRNVREYGEGSGKTAFPVDDRHGFNQHPFQAAVLAE